MAASPRSSVSIHRSTTSRRPYLSIDPLEFSLTDGTDIPAPPKEPDTPADSPISPTEEDQEKENSKPALSTQGVATSNGPLSSHPVTPIEAPSGSDKDGFPFNRQQSSSVSSGAGNKSNGQAARPGSSHLSAARLASPNGTPARTVTPTTSSPLSQHQYNGLRQPGQTMSPPGGPSQASPSHDPAPAHTTRRPSFAQRFLRLRSLSSLRSRNSSYGPTPTQQVHNNDQHFMDSSSRASAEALGHSNTMPGRGVKRPGSPSIAGLFRSAEQSTNSNGAVDGSRRASQSFPRMVRKKSMELLGSARRKSGMWSGRDTMNEAMAQEYEQERMRENDMDDSTEGGRDSTTMDGRESKLSIGGGRPVFREPPPTLPELESFNEMEGESMFSQIGVE